MYLFNQKSRINEQAQTGIQKKPASASQQHASRVSTILQLRRSGNPRATGQQVPSIHETARKGTSGASTRLPYLDRIRQSFGSGHDLGRIRANIGGSSALEATRAMGANAYATGEHVVFGNRPSLHTAAHEAAHIVQQRQGLRLPGGVGRAGDASERNADAVADRVVRGEKVPRDLLSAKGQTGSSAPVTHQPPVQMYTDIAGEPYNKLSDDGKLAVDDHTRDAWAESSNIKKSNEILKANNAFAEIKELADTLDVTPPGKKSPSITLKKFQMNETGTANEVELTDDCGSANLEMMGAYTAGYWSFVARNRRYTTEEFTQPSKYEADDNAPGGLVSTTERLSGEIYIRIFKREFKKTLTREEAVKAWDELGKTKQGRRRKRKLSKKYGINEYAVPGVGQGITIGSERDMPGGDKRPDGTGVGYNFHFGLNLLASGHDYITLEDFDASGVKYYFDMFGPHSKNQSWAEAESNVEELAAKTTTMVVQHPESLNGSINRDKVSFEVSTRKPTGKVKLAKDTKVTIIRKGRSWMKVEITSGPKTGETGWIRNKYFTDT